MEFSGFLHAFKLCLVQPPACAIRDVDFASLSFHRAQFSSKSSPFTSSPVVKAAQRNVTQQTHFA